MHAEKIDGTWQEVSPSAFRAARPNMMIPDPALEDAGLYAVTVDPQPETAWNEMADSALVDRNGYPALEWTVRPMTAQELSQARAGMELPRVEFILRSVAAGIITGEDGIAAAKGEVPPSLASLINGFDASQRTAAAIRWGAATRINRMDPLILGFAASFGVTDQQLDTLFA